MATFTKTTPFIRRIPLQGGGFYCFQSASEDLTLSLTETSAKKFRFSKFALLNIPDILNREFENTMKLNAIPGAWSSVNFERTTDWNVHFAESFQNYCLNLETMILSDADYDINEDRTISERVFFKWLKETGALRFEQQAIEGLDSSRYTEESDSEVYNRVVQYIGNIDVTDNLNSPVNSYISVFINVPTEVGNTPDVLFKSIDDNNYGPGMVFCKTDAGLNNEIIAGREYTDVHPDNLDIHAFYDNDSLTGLTLYKKITGRTDTQDDLVTDYTQDSWWYQINSNANCYNLEIDEFTNASNNTLAIKKDDTTLKFKRNKLDGITIDFDANSYNKFNPYLGAKTLYDIALGYGASDFKFNAVLVYYDLFDRTLGESEEFTETIYATNLFGVLFLDNLEPTSLGGAEIPRYTKCKPNQTINLNGNAFSFKVNLKLNISPLNSGVNVETFISDSNTFSMDIFADALREMLDLSETISNTDLALLSFDKRLRTLEDATKILNIKRIDDIYNRQTELENKMLDTNLIGFSNDKKNIIDLIDRNYNLVNDILTNKTSISVAYDLSHFKVAQGLEAKTLNDDLIVSRTNQEFMYTNKIKIHLVDLEQIIIDNNNKFLTYETELTPLKNYIRFDEEIHDSMIEPQNAIILYIKDVKNQWSTGQSFRIYFSNQYNFRKSSPTKDFWIYTDYANLSKKVGITNYAVKIRIPYTEFEKRSHRPIMELHCVDSTTMSFVLDFLN